jgi:hypothetical protein
LGFFEIRIVSLDLADASKNDPCGLSFRTDRRSWVRRIFRAADYFNLARKYYETFP